MVIIHESDLTRLFLSESVSSFRRGQKIPGEKRIAEIICYQY
jgi:hypothetical protein